MLRPADLSAARSEPLARLLAVAVWQAAERFDAEDPRQASIQRLLRRHARELVALHGLDAGEVLGLPRTGVGESHLYLTIVPVEQTRNTIRISATHLG